MDIKDLLNWIRKPVSGETAAIWLQPVWGAVHGVHLRSVYAVIVAFKLIIYHDVLPRTKDSDRFI